MLRHRVILFNTEYVYYRQREIALDVELQLNLQKSQTGHDTKVLRGGMKYRY